MKKIEDITLKKTNVEVFYESWIDENNIDTIVILHGWGGSSKSWLITGELLFKSGFNVIVPDLPGFGKTKLDKALTLDEYAIIIEKFIKELCLKNIILWGHSNGGAISIKIASKNKIELSRLILNNSAGIRNDKKRNFKRKILNSLSKIFKKLNKLPFYKEIRKIIYKMIGFHDYIEAEKNPFLKQTYLNIIKSDLKNIIPEIKQNTLLIWGENDTYTPRSDGIYMRNNIKNSKIIILENEKHGIHLTNPEKLVNTFLNNI